MRLVLKKFDAETGHGSPQGDATLDGALYQASYKRGGATETVKGETVGATVVFEGIPLGDIEVRELDPSGGYLLDRDAHRLHVTAADGPGRLLCHRGAARRASSARTRSVEASSSARAMPSATSTRTGTFWNYAQGDATFEGAEFTVYNRSANPVWYDANRDGRFQAVRGVRAWAMPS